VIREYPLWIAVVLPWLAALLVLLGTRPLLNLLGPRRTFVIAHHVGLGATALALLFLGQAIPHLLVADDPRALGDTLEIEWLHILVLGSTSIDTTLIGDRLAISASVLIGAGFVLARLFLGGPAGLRELELPELAVLAQADADAEEPEIPTDRATRALRRLALIGVLEGAAMLVVLASDLAVAALGWALIGLGSALAVARTLDDERRASLAARVLALAWIGDLALFGMMVLLVAGGIGLNHTQLWFPATGDRLFATALTGVPLTEVLALLLVVAVGARLVSLTRLANSIAEALLDAVVVAVPAVYLLVRHHRILGTAPSVLALVLIVGALLAVLGVAIALIRPGRAEARRSERPIGEQSLAGTGLAWFGLILLAVGLGAWRTTALLLLAHVLGRLGLRLALLTAEAGMRLPTITGRVTRVLAIAVAGVVPGLGFVALARLAAELLARNSLLGPWFGGLAALLVVVVAGAYAAALGRLWYQRAVDPPIAPASDEEDGLDFAPAALALLGLVVLGAMALAEHLGLAAGPTTWLDLSLPIAGGHPDVPLQVRETFRDELGDVGRSWKLGALVLVGVTTGFGWLWSRDQFRRGDGADLVGLATTVEQAFGKGRRAITVLASLFVGLTELAARGIGRGLYEQGPKVIASLARDVRAGVGPKLRRRGLWISGARAGVLGLAIGLMYVLGWLFFKPSVVSPGAVEPYGFGGLAPRLIRAGASERRPQDDPPVGDPAKLAPVDEPPKPLTDPRVPMPEVKR
jgi:NADH:ubiquinone oxidoreductase subunit 5 (subunit L)/multisubunit Na+/H+ antiporter MnhA subunit